MIVSLPKSTNALESPVRSPAGSHRKPKPDLFTILLAIALLAVLTAIVFLWLEVKAYDYKSTGAPMAMIGWVLAPTRKWRFRRTLRDM